MNVKPGDRIELIEMDDPDPLPAKLQGTVRQIYKVTLWSGFIQIDVDWDNGRSLMLTVPPDKFKVLEKETA